MAKRKRAGWLSNEDGASGLELGMVMGVVAVVTVAVASGFVGKVREIFGGTSNAVDLVATGNLAPGQTIDLRGGVPDGSAPAILTTSLASGTLGTVYSQALSASVSQGHSVAWSLDSGSLPPGLSLTSSAVLGTPTTLGTYTFAIKATDTSNSLSSTQSYSVSVSATAPTINTSTPLPAATYGVAYSQTLSATTFPSGDGVTWSASGAGFPVWLSLNTTTGVLSGTPNSPILGTFSVAATDKISGLASSLACTLSVVSAAPSISTSSLPNSVWGTAYSQTFAGTTTPGGDGIAWSFGSGTLPTGLGLNGSTGVVSGTPAAQGSFPLAVVATDSVTGATATRTMTLTGTATAPSISTSSLPAAYSGQSYSQTFAASTYPSGHGLSWSLSSGTLPSGLSLNGSTGVLSGTPASSGTFPLTVAATDSVTGAVGTASLSGGLVVSAAQVVNVTVSSNANNVDFRSLLTAAGWGGSTPVAGTVTIASGVWIGSSSTSTPALAISGSFPSGSTLVLVNNGHISGAGGYQNSAVGGTAIQASVPVSIQNNGYVWGGGGAGGHAGTVLTGFWSDSSRHDSTFGNGGAGGGGGGTVAGWGATATAGYAGSNGSGCHGGTGGAPGYGGASGANCDYGGNSAGGAAGNYIVGNSYVTWSTAGTRLGGAS